MKRRAKNCKGCNLEDFNQTWKILPCLTKDFQVNYSLNPEVNGHLVIQPRFHATSIADLSTQQSRALGILIRDYCRALQKSMRPAKIYVYSFNEAKGYHLHIHLKPKPHKVPRDVTGAKFVDWFDPNVKTDRASVEKLLKKIVRAVPDFGQTSARELK